MIPLSDRPTINIILSAVLTNYYRSNIVMEELKKALKLQAKLYNADTAFVSISTLDMGRKYQITDISKVQSTYGLRILVSLQGDRRILKTYLPKSIRLSDSYIDSFINRDRRSVLYLIYKGVKSNGAYKIDFE